MNCCLACSDTSASLFDSASASLFAFASAHLILFPSQSPPPGGAIAAAVACNHGTAFCSKFVPKFPASSRSFASVDTAVSCIHDIKLSNSAQISFPASSQDCLKNPVAVAVRSSANDTNPNQAFHIISRILLTPIMIPLIVP